MKYTLFPFFEDGEPAYTQKELAEFENRKVTYNGEEMTEYDATQKQRAMERRIRATKRELAGYDAGINSTDDDSLKADLQAAFDRKSVLLKKQEATLKDFTKQTGLTRDRSRERVSAHFDTTQGKVVSFNKSVSQKAILANKRALQIAEEKRIIIEIKAAGIRGTISLHPTVPDLSDFSFDFQHISERNHNVTKNEAVHFIHNALFSSSVWNGEFVNYFSEEGAAYVDMKNMLIRTAFKKDEFTEPVIKALEVLKKHGKK